MNAATPIGDVESLRAHIANCRVAHEHDFDAMVKALEHLANCYQYLVAVTTRQAHRQQRIEALLWSCVAIGILSPMSVWLMGFR